MIAYVRNPSKVPSSWGNNVSVVVGELNDAEAVDRVELSVGLEGAPRVNGVGATGDDVRRDIDR